MKTLFVLSLAILIPLAVPAHPEGQCGSIPKGRSRSDSLYQWEMMRERKKQTKLLEQLRDDQRREAIRSEYRELRERRRSR
jgi:hypothetical protein